MLAGVFEPLTLSQRLERASIVVSGKIIAKELSFYDSLDNLIYSPYYLIVEQSVKGPFHKGDTIVFLIEGGQVGTTKYVNTAEIMPPEGSNVIVFLNTKNGKIFPAFKGYSFLFIENNKVSDIMQTYPLSTVEKALNISLKKNSANANIKNNRLLVPTISSVSPSNVCAGCWDTIEITGSNFGSTQGSGYVAFKDPDLNNPFVDIDSPLYYLYWDNYLIRMIVPFSAGERSGTGAIVVCNSLGQCDTTNPGFLTISYALYQYIYQGSLYDVHYYDASGSGGYAIQPSNVFKSVLQRWQAFKRAMKTWRCETFINLDTLGGTTSTNTQGNDGVFVAAFNSIDGPSGTLAFATYWFSAQWNSATSDWDWTISHFDIVFDDAENWYYGTGTTPATQINFEAVALHELGHVIGLGHVLNSDVMYPIYADRRTLTADNINAVTQKLNYSTVGTHPHAVMQPLNPSNCNFLCELQTDVTYANPTCAGGSTGWIRVRLLNGTPPYNHSWTPTPPIRNTAPDGSVDSISGLTAGTWVDTIVDANYCPGIVSIQLTDPPPINIALDSMTPIRCAGDSNGAIYVSVSGGTPPYSYLWSPSGQTTEDISGLPAGNYTLGVTDANGCLFGRTFFLTEPDTLKIILDSIKNLLCYGDSSGAILITITGGTGPYNIAWSTGDTIEDLINLSGGQYSVSVVDSHGCNTTDTFIVLEPPLLIVNVSWNPPSSCGDTGTASITISGGIPPYSVQWSTGQTDSTVNIPAGTYSVSVTDNNGCQWDTSVVFSEPNAPIIFLDSIVDVKCFGDSTGAIYITANGGTPPYIFQWSNGSTTEDLINIPAGLYTITVSGSDQCKSFNSFTVNQPPPLVVSIYYDSLTHQMWAIISGGTPTYSIEWNNTLTVDTILIIGPGSYWVKVIDNNGCIAYDTLTINGQPSATTNPFDEHCSLFQHNTNVLISCSDEIIRLDIYDLTGKSIISLKPHSRLVRVDNLTKGLYILKVHANNKVLTRKIIIH